MNYLNGFLLILAIAADVAVIVLLLRGREN